MLHDIGKLVMLTYFGSELDQSARIARENSIPLYQAEKQNLGVDDAEIGAYLLSLWGISDTILESTALHYQPNKSTNPVLNVLTCVHLAYAFDQDNGNESKQDKKSALDMDYLQKLGLSDQIEDLHNLFLGAVT
jgi:HD-like signal output (HDOD) protein